ncbi:hypothetical protein RRG08_011654 [Elysia crispata]|uniref:Uncharacterized protein n=1 Tax=Elysia crispata TaxID=231223 RepID=A0AAE1D0A1_9GAST|nr:hypothetical protein RRG08_011654 [Elysia crispata]
MESVGGLVPHIAALLEPRKRNTPHPQSRRQATRSSGNLLCRQLLVFACFVYLPGTTNTDGTQKVLIFGRA